MKIDIKVLNYITHYYLQPFEPLSSDFEKWVSWDKVITPFLNLFLRLFKVASCYIKLPHCLCCLQFLGITIHHSNISPSIRNRNKRAKSPTNGTDPMLPCFKNLWNFSVLRYWNINNIRILNSLLDLWLNILPPGFLGSRSGIVLLCSAVQLLRLQNPLLKSQKLLCQFQSARPGLDWIGLQCQLTGGWSSAVSKLGKTFAPPDHYCQSRKGQSSCYRAKKLS